MAVLHMNGELRFLSVVCVVVAAVFSDYIYMWKNIMQCIIGLTNGTLLFIIHA